MNRTYLAGGTVLLTIVVTAATYGLAPLVAIMLFVIGMTLSAIIYGLGRVYETSESAARAGRPIDDAAAAWIFPAALLSTLIIIGVMMAGLRRIDDGRARMGRDSAAELQAPPAETRQETQGDVPLP